MTKILFLVISVFGASAAHADCKVDMMSRPLCLNAGEAEVYCQTYGNQPDAVTLALKCVNDNTPTLKSAGVADGSSEMRNFLSQLCFFPKVQSTDPRVTARLCE